MATTPVGPSPAAAPALRTPGEIKPEQALRAIDEVNGVHPGCRAAHARGTICTGSFVALEYTRGITRAVQMRGTPVAATVRFSNAAGDPGVPDGEPDVRGMAVRLAAPDTEADAPPVDIVAVTLPTFFVNTPREFVAFTRCFRNGGPGRGPKERWLKLIPFLVRHRSAWRALKAVKLSVPSYANCAYGALHAYRWVNAAGDLQYVRYWWVPEEGERRIKARDARSRPRDYLQQDLVERLGRTPPRPFRFQLYVEFAGDDDQEKIAKPAAPWNGSRRCVGVLELSGLAATPSEPLVFDPTTETPGIEVSDDELLRFRPSVYELSERRRKA
jgi:catalase